MATTSERLKQLMKERNLRQIDILEKSIPYCKKYDISLSKSSLNQYISGYAVPGQHKLMILALALNVREAWLMGYDVPMEREENSPEQNELSEGEKIWLSLYNRLSEEAREAIITTASALEQLPAESQKIFLSMLRGALGSQA